MSIILDGDNGITSVGSVKVDELKDKDGTGSPSFPFGIESTSLTTPFIQIATAGAGIKFGTRNNNLDDYEEGVHTVTITTFTGSVTLDSTNNKMGYTKIGRVVFITARLEVESVSSPTGAIIFSLPFVPSADGVNNQNSAAANIRIDGSASKNYTDFVGGFFGPDLRGYIGDVNVIASGGANAQQIQAGSFIDIQAHYFV